MGNLSVLMRWGLPLGVLAYLGFLLISNKESKATRSLDFDGGIRLEYKMGKPSVDESELDVPRNRKADLEQSKNAFYYRLRNFDLTENAVKISGDDKILVEVPDDKGVEESLNRTGVLTFREVLEEPYDENKVPLEAKKLLFKKRSVVDEKVKYFYYRLGPPLLLASDIDYYETKAESYSPTSDNPTFRHTVRLCVVPSARQKLRSITTKLYKKNVAICVDNVIYTIATVMSKNIEIAEITGFSEAAEAKSLANILSGGYLPASFELVSRRVMGPRFGLGLKAQALEIIKKVALLIVILLVLRYAYHMSLIAIAAVSLALFSAMFCTLIVNGAMKFSGATVCAFVVLIGMSVDNLILVFEQFLEKVYSAEGGVSRGSQALRDSYDKEKVIILVANVTTVAALSPLLYIEGPVRDLIKSMLWGLGVAYVTTVFYARFLYGSDAFIRVFDRLSPCERTFLPVDFNIFARGSRFALVILYMSVLLFSIMRLAEEKIIWGVDLRGGTEMSIILDREVDDSILRAKAQQFFGERSEVFSLDAEEVNGTNEYRYAVRFSGTATTSATIMSDSPGKSYAAADDVIKTPGNFIRFLVDTPGFESASLASVESVGATDLAVSRKAVVGCTIAGVIVLLLILGIYYGFMAAAAVIIALITDAVIALGAMSVFHVPVSIPMVACLLTLIGYSVNDSILLCGHLRDYYERMKGQGLMCESMECVLKPFSSRVLLTSLTTLCASICLWFLGFTTIRDFGIILSVGVFFGMLSSVTLVVYMLEPIMRFKSNAR